MRVFHESRLAPPPVPPAWAPVAAAFHGGATREALRLARPLAAAGPPAPAAALLLGDVLRAGGDEAGFAATIRAAAARAPRDLRLQVQRIRVEMMKGRHLSALRRLDGLQLVAGGPWLLLLDALRASGLAQLGRAGAARKVIERLHAKEALGEPLRAYEVAYAHAQLREWEEAARLLVRVAAACPRWARPRLHLYEALRALDRHDEAVAALDEAAAVAPEEAAVALARLGALHGRRAWGSLVDEARAFVEASAPETEPERSAVRGVRSLAVRALWRDGRRAEAAEAARSVEAAWAERLAGAAPDARATRVPVVPIVQDRNMCVAASVAMALRHMGQPADPREVFAEMARSSRGVTDAELDRWLRARSLEPLDVALDLDAVRAALDRGLPLLATRARMLMGHMELIVGYDDGLEELEVIDPAHGLPVHVPYDGIEDAWGHAGEAFVALAPAGTGGDLPPSARDAGAAARREVERALDAGDVLVAQRLAAALPQDDWQTARLLTSHLDALVPEERREDLLLGLAADERADVSTRLQATLSLLGTRHAPPAEATLRALRPTFTPFFRAWLRLQRAAAAGHFPRALRCAELLLERAGGLETLWLHLASALEACGRAGDAEVARAMALELEPDHPGPHLAALRSPTRSLEALRARQATLARLLRAHPDATELRISAAFVAFDLGEPLAAERLLREGLARGPHSTVLRQALRRYYLHQGRRDLADAVAAPPAGDALPGALGASALLALGREEASRGEPGPALTELEARCAVGRLEPFAALDLAGLRLLTRLAQGDATPDELVALFPAELPSPRAAALARLIDAIPPLASELAAALHARALAALEGEEWTADARFACAWLDEQAGRLARADRVYAELGHADAVFRRSIVARLQGSLDEAAAHLERAVALVPAHLQSWESLADVRAEQGDKAGEERARRRLVELLPYHPGVARALLTHLAPIAGRRWMETNGGRYPASHQQWWEARRALEEERYAGALEALGPELREELPREALVLELQALHGAGRTKPHRDRLDQALERFPDDPWFNHVAAGLEKDPAAARARYARAFAAEPHPALASELAKRAEARELAGVFAEAVLAAPPPVRRRALGYALQLLERLADLRPAVELVERVDRARPDDPAVHLRLVQVYGLAGLDADATPLADQLLDARPDDPATLWVCATALFERRPLRALDLYERHHRLTKDPDAVLQAARCEHRLGRREAARARYWQCLELRGAAGDPVALANLVRLGEDPLHLHEPLQRLVGATQPTWIPEVARAAVQAALAAGAPLPATWGAWARARLDALKKGAPARSGEATDLEDMLRAWADARNEGILLQSVGGSPGLLERIGKRKVAWWADRRWIPAAAAVGR